MKRTTLFTFVLTALLFATTIAYQPVRLVHANAEPVSPSANVPTVPLYRLFAHSSGIHFYTIDVNRKLEAMGAGWTSEGVAAHILNQQAPGTVPLYVLVVTLAFETGHGGDAVFAYTTSEQEKNQILNNPKVTGLLGGGLTDGSSSWRLDASGVAGFVASTQLFGTVPLYRLYHPPNFSAAEGGYRHCRFNSYDALYTTSEKEKKDAIQNHGYKFVRIEGYVWPQATSVGPHVPKGAPPPDPDTDLLKRGCKRSGLGVYGCPTQNGYDACETYRKNGKVKSCWTAVSPQAQAAQAKMEKELFSVGCDFLLGRRDEFRCKTQPALDACNVYLQKGQAKKCLKAWK